MRRCRGAAAGPVPLGEDEARGGRRAEAIVRREMPERVKEKVVEGLYPVWIPNCCQHLPVPS